MRIDPFMAPAPAAQPDAPDADGTAATTAPFADLLSALTAAPARSSPDRPATDGTAPRDAFQEDQPADPRPDDPADTGLNDRLRPEALHLLLARLPMRTHASSPAGAMGEKAESLPAQEAPEPAATASPRARASLATTAEETAKQTANDEPAPPDAPQQAAAVPPVSPTQALALPEVRPAVPHEPVNPDKDEHAASPAPAALAVPQDAQSDAIPRIALTVLRQETHFAPVRPPAFVVAAASAKAVAAPSAAPPPDAVDPMALPEPEQMPAPGPWHRTPDRGAPDRSALDGSALDRSMASDAGRPPSNADAASAPDVLRRPDADAPRKPDDSADAAPPVHASTPAAVPPPDTPRGPGLPFASLQGIGRAITQEAARLSAGIPAGPVPTQPGPVRVLDLALTPEDLGRVVVRMRLTPSGLSVKVHADNPATAKMLEADRPRLAALLAADGSGAMEIDLATGAAAPLSAPALPAVPSPQATADDARARGQDQSGQDQSQQQQGGQEQGRRQGAGERNTPQERPHGPAAHFAADEPDPAAG